MGRYNLQWEDVIQFEEVKGYGQHIWRDGINFITLLRRRDCSSAEWFMNCRMSYLALLENGERTLLEISWKIKNDCWPPTEEEKLINQRSFIKYPTSLIDFPRE